MGFPGGTVVENPPTNAEPHGEGCYLSGDWPALAAVVS